MKKWTVIWILMIWASAFYFEFACYYVNSYSWPHMQCKSRERKCLSILVVADPSLASSTGLLGLGWLTIWDADRYLRKTFIHARLHTSPDLVIFIGDFMTTSKIASKSEYRTYIQRFHSIYHEAGTAAMLFVPGAHVTGGLLKIRPITGGRLTRLFGRRDQALTAKISQFTNFIVYNQFYHNENVHHVSNNIRGINIVLTTIDKSPNTQKGELFALRPHLIISKSHSQKTMYNRYSDLWTGQSNRIQLNSNEPVNIDLSINNALTELQLPSCNYRISGSNAAFGHLILEQENFLIVQAQFSALGLPNRCLGLCVYFMIFFMVIINKCFINNGMRQLLFSRRY